MNYFLITLIIICLVLDFFIYREEYAEKVLVIKTFIKKIRIIEKIKNKFYKNHIRYTKQIRYTFPSGMTYATEFEPFWYLKEIVRSDGHIIETIQITKEEYQKGKREQKLERILLWK